jgi:nucleoside-diphosphate-sugar epimerase
MSEIVIAGVGYVGTRLAELLTSQGHSVFGLRRSPAPTTASYRPLTADLTQAASLRGCLPSATTHLVFAAGPDNSTDADYQRVYVQGLSNLLSAAQDLPRLQRIALVSSTSVFAQSAGEWVTETSPTLPEHFSGRRVLEAEALLSEAPCSSTILRCAGIYGPGRTRLIDSVREGRATFDPENPVYTNRIHRDDVARAVAHLLFRPQVNALYLGVDTAPSPDGEVFTWLAHQLNAPAPLQAPSSATPEGRRSGSNKRCSSASLVATGFEFTFPTFREGYAAMLAGAPSSA